MTIAEKLRQEGIEVGAKLNAIEVAKNLIKINLTIQQITDATGLPKIEVEKIAQEMKH